MAVPTLVAVSISFATVFAIEAVGLLVILRIFQGVSVRQFRTPAIELEQVLRALD